MKETISFRLRRETHKKAKILGAERGKPVTDVFDEVISKEFGNSDMNTRRRKREPFFPI